MKAHLHINDSYNVWSPTLMHICLQVSAYNKYHTSDYCALLGRSKASIYIEWWAHNIGYYLTKPIINFDYFYRLNQRFAHVDLTGR